MRKLGFAFGTAVASLIAVAAVTVPAGAFGTPAPAGLSADAQNIGLTQDVAYVCRWGYYGRRCFWQPGYYAYGYAPGYYGYRPYRPWGYYRPYRRWRW
jgi:hypothetical protein